MISEKILSVIFNKWIYKYKASLLLILLTSIKFGVVNGQGDYVNEFPNIKPCGNIFYDFSDLNRVLPNNCNDVRTEGYGSSCINNDATIPALPQPACGKYRVPIAFRKIAEDDCSGLPQDIDQTLDDELCYLNELFCDLNIEFFECPRPAPICNSDFYDFDAQTAGDNDDNQIQSENIPDVINIYIPNTIIGFNGNAVGGYAPVGGNSGNPRMLVGLQQIGQYPANVSGCGITACGGTGQMYPTIAHEMGHFFGLRHPFFNNAGGNDLADNSLCCTESDFTCDTDPDPYEISMSGGNGCNGAPSCTYNGTDLDVLGNQYNSYTHNNIMGYWPFSCATIFTPFQERRMYDALIYCNTYLCCTTPEAYLADATLQEQTICKNDVLPNIPGLANRCFDWYDAEDATANLIASATTTLTAAQLATVVNNTVPGIYTIYMQDANSYQDPPCRIPVTINVLAEPGDASANGMAAVEVNNCGAAENVQLATDVDALADGCVVGWWITETNPASNGIVDDVTLTTAVGGATIGSPINNPVDNIIESTGGNPVNELSLSFDCSSLDENLTYYATPVVAKSADVIQDVICNNNTGDGQHTSVNNGDFDGSIIPVPCPANCSPTTSGEDANFTLTINVTTFNELLPAQLSIRLRDGSCTNNLVSTSTTITAVPATITFTNADFSDGYDPCADLCIFLINFNSDFTQGSPTIEFDYDLDVTYPGASAVVFPSLNSYSDCLFGNAVELTCACAACASAVTVPNSTGDTCPAGTDDFTIWQADVNAANPLDAAQDPDGSSTIVYSSVMPTNGTTNHDDILVDGSYTGDNCANDTETTMAYLYCDPDATPNTGDETYQLISTYTLTIWPTIQTPTIVNDGACGPAINTLPCPGYMVANDYDGNGATPDFSAETDMGALMFSITNPGAPTNCLSLAVPSSFNCQQATPIPVFDCPGTMNKCGGALSLNAADNEIQTAATSVGSWSGSGVGYIITNGAGISDDEFDPTSAPLGIPLTLVLTLTNGTESTSTVECTIIVVQNCEADGGRF